MKSASGNSLTLVSTRSPGHRSLPLAPGVGLFLRNEILHHNGSRSTFDPRTGPGGAFVGDDSTSRRDHGGKTRRRSTSAKCRRHAQPAPGLAEAYQRLTALGRTTNGGGDGRRAESWQLGETGTRIYNGFVPTAYPDDEPKRRGTQLAHCSGDRSRKPGHPREVLGSDEKSGQRLRLRPGAERRSVCNGEPARFQVQRQDASKHSSGRLLFLLWMKPLARDSSQLAFQGGKAPLGE